MPTLTLRLGDLSVGFIQSLTDAVISFDKNPGPLLEQYALDPTRLSQAGARLSIPRYMRLGHAAIQLTGQPGLGLRMGQLSRFAQAGLAGVTAAQAPTVREAARTLIRFEPLYGSNYRGQSSFHEDAEGAWMRFYSISPYNAYNRFVVDSILSGWIAQLATLAGTELRAQRIEIEFDAPAYAAQYASLSDSPVMFAAATNQLRLDQASLALRNPDHCPSTWRHLLQLCERELEQQTRTRSLRERIIQLLGPLLNGGREPDLEEVAARLKLPTWTLRRKLAEEGTRFRAVLNDTRRDLAMTYIRDTELAFGEIAYLLGFASAEAFQRAFKRWNGQTPGEFRRSQRQSA
ncbi:AraC family transcriptional regulator [Pseudomonas syringae pv. theae ICMP 3923]|uniref:AraC family transcriptional regulator n=9 Tax=Pseudomonas syringae group TaxID=136849 RepID=A0A261WF24_9PSED|nr:MULTISPECIES: AraC family transcriptional regulator [Pseudomonas syringae group]POD81364.1 AraC family transcriptional regulator [Pseudomonas syringae group genomosp. 3]ATV19031.1 AraC family transcriptional regulator [Pseudomonas syringae pv. actinidiae]EKG31051.1 AraC family transcriptional regulator [Pseudomonas avellanae BPIC 631]EPM45236.1 AraC family transcriptional regulator [Pseudomonas syringae pv. actinidiae ICMP 19098]EPM71818.1 AraC family transcriptional regulator [Pseudomonas 